MKKKICPCGLKSIPGLIASVALCQKHYNDLMFGDIRGDNEARRQAQSILAMNYSKPKSKAA
jgi:hypothetical protein